MRHWLWLPGVIGIGRGEGVRKPDTPFATRLTRDGKMCGFAVRFRGRWYSGMTAQEGNRR